jgi:S-formylglutathione hydrolase FrmB
MILLIEENFQVSSSPDKRGIMGAYAGGHGAIVTAFQNSDFLGT